jgi:hypothetical protein
MTSSFDATYPGPTLRPGRHSRIWLLALLVFTTLLAFAALFAKYKLEGLRTTILGIAETKTGLQLDVASVSVSGLRTLQLEDVHIAHAPDAGPSVTYDAPLCVVYIDLLELITGNVSVDRIQSDGATIIVERSTEGRWLSPQKPLFESPGSDGGAMPFHITGSDCRIELRNVVADTSCSLEDLAFTAIRMAETNQISVDVTGYFNGAETKKLELDLQFASLEDFNLRTDLAEITPEDVNIFLPAPTRLVETGRLDRASLRVSGHAGPALDLTLEVPFNEVTVRGQPDVFEPIDGTLSVVARYDLAEKKLAFTSANANANQFSGGLDGSIVFSQGYPQLDLHLEARQLPIKALLQTLSDYAPAAAFGEVDVSISEDCALTLSLTGSTDAPIIGARLSAGSGEISFVPNDPRFPGARIELGRMEGAWETGGATPGATIAISGGEIRHAETGIEATGITGALRLHEGAVVLDPFNADFTGHRVSGHAEYNYVDRTGNAQVSGTLANLEKSPLASRIKKTRLVGSVHVAKASATLTPEKLTFEGDVDATQTEIAYAWWFKKPIGVNATANIKGTLVPKKSIVLQSTANVAGAEGTAENRFAHTGRRWQLRKTNAQCEALDITTIGKSLRIPYTVTGGTGSAGHYSWERLPGSDNWTSNMGCTIDRVELLTPGLDVPMRIFDAALDATISQDEQALGTLSVNAKRGDMPPLTKSWFVPIHTDPELLELFPPSDRTWTYTLKAEEVSVPPWKGTAFDGEAYMGTHRAGLTHYSATIGDGTISGTFENNRDTNAYTSTAQWTGVPASYFMDHLAFPHVFNGAMSGHVVYALDRDDPDTLSGDGYFQIEDGQFSADYLFAQFEEQLAAEEAVLPPSLRFNKLESNIHFDSDRIRTPDLKLEAPAMSFLAQGHFVRDGDLDYNLNVDIPPDTAARIPQLQEKFNLEGLRLAQQDLSLEFQLQGPSDSPEITVKAIPPPGVTITSTVLEVGSEVFGTPLKVLGDLLKGAGGLAGAGR